MFLSGWSEFPSALCFAETGGGGDDDNSRLHVVEIAASTDMLPFSLCNKKTLAIWHMNRPIFTTTLSIPSYDIGKYVVLGTYQPPRNPLIYA